MSNTSITTISVTAHTMISHDGATIGYLRMGKGPAVIVVPGALSVAAGYTGFARTLAEHFTVHIIERRGRGSSSPQNADYSITKERDDVLTLQRITEASFLVGHSFGGLVALEAARNNPSLRKIAVYEPGVSVDGSISMSWIPGYEQKLAKQKYLDAFVEFARGTGPEQARNARLWIMKLLMPLIVKSDDLKLILSLLPENLREHREVGRLDNSYTNYREISASTLLMYGGKTNARWVDLSMERLTTVLPHAERWEFPSLDHFGIDKKAPDEVARAVCTYFLKP